MIEFSNGFLLSLSLCLDIGIANIAMITLAMQRGYFHGFWLGMGTCVGDLAYALLALAGMAVLLQYEAVRWILWIGGGAMLLWFATVGGALISRMGQHSVTATAWFLSGFFIAGMFWTCVLCLVGSFGGKLLGQRLLRYSYIASALIFSYFALYVIVSGYREFMVT
ncbi:MULTISPECIES: LysE family transporter [Pantoea]|uniref:LysE family transporter n=1 Tax=Pantoea TaxID=53335 RepID=UPI00165461DD|nr:MULTISPECIES: LysE family transporter [Pantoea]